MPLLPILQRQGATLRRLDLTIRLPFRVRVARLIGPDNFTGRSVNERRFHGHGVGSFLVFSAAHAKSNAPAFLLSG